MLIEYPTEVSTSRLSAANERSMIGDYHPQFSSSHTYLPTVWQAAYFGINRANAVIGRVPAINMDPTRRDQIVGEAKFLRALHYYFLAGLFGGVPLKLTETTSIGGDNIAARQPRRRTRGRRSRSDLTGRGRGPAGEVAGHRFRPRHEGRGAHAARQGIHAGGRDGRRRGERLSGRPRTRSARCRAGLHARSELREPVRRYERDERRSDLVVPATSRAVGRGRLSRPVVLRRLRALRALRGRRAEPVFRRSGRSTIHTTRTTSERPARG